MEHSVAPVNTYSSAEAGTPFAPAVRAAPAPAPVMPLPDVRSGGRPVARGAHQAGARCRPVLQEDGRALEVQSGRAGLGMQSAQIWKCTRLRVKRSVRTPAEPKRIGTLSGKVSRSLRVLPGRASLSAAKGCWLLGRGYNSYYSAQIRTRLYPHWTPCLFPAA